MHKGQQASGVAFAPDGQTLASAGYQDKTIRLWDVATGQEIRSIEAPGTGELYCVAFAPDGKTLAAGSGQPEGVAHLWDVGTGQEIRTLPGHLEVQSLAFTPDGKTLVTAGGPVQLWDVGTGKEIGPVAGTHYSVAFAPDGQTLATEGDRIRLWDAATGNPLRTLPPRQGTLLSLTFAADWQDPGRGHLGRPDDPALGSRYRQGNPHSGDAACATGWLLWVADDDARFPDAGLYGWLRNDPAVGREYRPAPRHPARGPTTLIGAKWQFAPDGKTLAAVGANGLRGLAFAPTKVIRLWDVGSRKRNPHLRRAPRRASCAAVFAGRQDPRLGGLRGFDSSMGHRDRQRNPRPDGASRRLSLRWRLQPTASCWPRGVTIGASSSGSWPAARKSARSQQDIKRVSLRWRLRRTARPWPRRATIPRSSSGTCLSGDRPRAM